MAAIKYNAAAKRGERREMKRIIGSSGGEEEEAC